MDRKRKHRVMMENRWCCSSTRVSTVKVKTRKNLNPIDHHSARTLDPVRAQSNPLLDSRKKKSLKIGQVARVRAMAVFPSEQWNSAIVC